MTLHGRFSSIKILLAFKLPSPLVCASLMRDPYSATYAGHVKNTFCAHENRPYVSLNMDKPLPLSTVGNSEHAEFINHTTPQSKLRGVVSLMRVTPLQPTGLAMRTPSVSLSDQLNFEGTVSIADYTLPIQFNRMPVPNRHTDLCSPQEAGILPSFRLKLRFLHYQCHIPIHGGRASSQQEQVPRRDEFECL
jgi:hypothetical protein